jgi:histidinol-phosphate/aromatic aminotransferase/cobyric acid decarboxylase-like protein
MMIDEKDRFYSRLASIPGIRPMPSPPVSDWILLQVDHPQELARRVNRKLNQGAPGAPGVVTIPRQHPGAVRIPVCEPRKNEQLLRTLKEAISAR